MTGSIPPGSNPLRQRTTSRPVKCCAPGASGLGGGGAAKAIGNQSLGYLADLCGLHSRLYGAGRGCGWGRMALRTGYLNRKGGYAGFDLSKSAIAWCTENISGSYLNFDFRIVDIHNGGYNPKGIFKSSELRFPYPDESFGVESLASVFTHMLAQGVRRHLYEIVRVLKSAGRTDDLSGEDIVIVVKPRAGVFRLPQCHRNRPIIPAI